MLIGSLRMKSRKRLNRDVLDTEVTHAEAVHDVTWHATCNGKTPALMAVFS